MQTKTKLTDDQLAFLEEAFLNELQRAEEAYLEGMERGYYDWGEWRQMSNEITYAIMKIYHIFGVEREVNFWKGTLKDTYEDEHRKWTEKDDENLERYLNE